MKNLKKALFIAAGLVMLLGTEGVVLGYGGGGEGTGTSWGQSGTVDPATAQITQLSQEEIERIFSALDEETRERLTEALAGTDLTPRELMTIRQGFLERDMESAQMEAALIHGLTVTVEGLDEAGQWSQLGLAFVPGVGWVTSGLIDTARGGANAYRDGKDVNEILSSAAIAGVSSVTINKLSPLGADESFNSARAALNMLKSGSGKNTGKLVKVFIKGGVKFVGKKETERRAGDAMSAALASSTKQAPNRAPAPDYINSELGYDVTPMGTRVYK